MFARKDPLAAAVTRVDAATVSFYDSIALLKTAAADLDAIASEADGFATEAALRAGTARSQAAVARRRADRIEALLG